MFTMLFFGVCLARRPHILLQDVCHGEDVVELSELSIAAENPSQSRHASEFRSNAAHAAPKL